MSSRAPTALMLRAQSRDTRLKDLSMASEARSQVAENPLAFLQPRFNT